MASEYYFEKYWFNTESNRKILIWQFAETREIEIEGLHRE